MLAQRPAAAVIAALVCLGTAGCYIPPLGRQLDERFIVSIQPGVTTRADVHKRVPAGEMWPATKLLENDRFLAFTGGANNGGVLFLAGPGGVIGFELAPRSYRVLLEFDERNVVRKCRVEKFGAAAKEAIGPPFSPRVGSSDPRSSIVKTPGRTLITRRELGGAASAVAVSPDGRFIAAGTASNSAVVFDTTTGRRRAFNGTPVFLPGIIFASPVVRAVTFSPDGQAVTCVGLDRQMKTFGPADGAKRPAVKSATAIAHSPDGSVIATGHARGVVKLRDPATNKVTWVFHPGKRVGGAVWGVAFSPDGRLVAGATSPAGTGERKRRLGLLLWDAATGQVLPEPPEAAGFHHVRYGSGSDIMDRTASVAFSPDGRFLALAGDQHVEIWNVLPAPAAAGGPPASPLGALHDVLILPFGDGTRGGVSFSPDGRLLAAHNDEGGVVWNLAASEPVWRGKRCSLAFNPAGRSIVVGSPKGVESIELPRLPDIAPANAVVDQPTRAGQESSAGTGTG